MSLFFARYTHTRFTSPRVPSGTIRFPIRMNGSLFLRQVFELPLCQSLEREKNLFALVVLFSSPPFQLNWMSPSGLLARSSILLVHFKTFRLLCLLLKDVVRSNPENNEESLNRQGVKHYVFFWRTYSMEAKVKKYSFSYFSHFASTPQLRMQEEKSL